MPRNNPTSLWDALRTTGSLSARVAAAAEANASWGELAAESVLGNRRVDLQGRSVLLATIEQFTVISALIQLDGVARRVVLCPPDLPLEQFAYVAETAAVDLIVTDRDASGAIDSRIECIVPQGRQIIPGGFDRSSQVETEWILLTSGTTGLPKLVVHTLASLAGAIEHRAPSSPVVWSTFYDIRRYGGLQIFLRAALTGASLVLKGAQESLPEFIARAGELNVTHISGTPSHWRRALMSSSAGLIAPDYVRLSGEISDQAIIHHLQEQYPQAKVAHAFASTEAGVAFVVNDALMGFPAELVGNTPGVDMKVEDSTLRIRSNRTASRYLGEGSRPLRDADGYVNTGDALELRDGRFYFVGRLDGTINVGGLKVHPEEVEAVINRHPGVSMSLVRTKRSPITGALVVADVVLQTESHPRDGGSQSLQNDILQFCRGELARHKVPVAINFVHALPVAESGKLVRPHA
jgi:acyl-coenzyme A synthetase/AMP-(fatty) acid ligase